jgi:small subunit ribosomal protein S16
MLMIRLQRVGRKNDPSFRVVLTDRQNSTKSGKFLEVLGSYDARQGKPILKGDRIKYWMSQGAKVTDTMNNLLVGNKIVEGTKINVLPKRKVDPKAEAAKVAAAAPVAEEVKEEVIETPAEEVPVPAETVEVPAEEAKLEEEVA